MADYLGLPSVTWTRTFLGVAIVSGLPLVVTVIMARREAALRRWLPQLTAFGAGAVLGAALGHLIPEARALGQTWASIAAGVAMGFLAFGLIERLLATHDHAHAHGVPLGAPSAHDSDSSEAECVHLHPTPAVPHRAHSAKARALAPMAFIGDALHNFVDGALIAAGFLTNPSVGVLTLLAVALHELPREVGTFGLFVHGGIRPMKAVMYNSVTAIVALIGATLTLTIGHRISNTTTLLLPFAAGTYLYISQAVARASLHDRHDDPVHWSRLGWSVAGMGLMLISGFLG